MELRIIKNGSSSQNSLKRIIAFFGFLILSGGFILMAYKGKLVWQMFLSFPAGAVLLYSPQLFKDLLLIWKRQDTEGGQRES